MTDLPIGDAVPIAPAIGAVAPQNKEKLRVFISYSREDLDFADQLNAALETCGFDCDLDRHGIEGGEKWQARLGDLIANADTIVFVLSPASARSDMCAWEVGEATRLSKRILPIVARPLEGVEPPTQLKESNYVFFCLEPKAPGSGFGVGLAKLVAALNTDFDWLREHTRYAQRAAEWNDGRPANRLLSGDDIRIAKEWLARRPKNAPEATSLQLDFIRASEAEADARLKAERTRLEEMTAAQDQRAKALRDAETALEQAAREQRRASEIERSRSRLRNIGLAVMSALAIAAVGFGVTAEMQRREAERRREETDSLLFRTSRIIADLQAHMDFETKKEAFAAIEMGAMRGDPMAMRSLGIFYRDGFGVTQDYGKAREWFEKSADAGNERAKFSLGLLYESGAGVVQDRAKARELYEKAAENGLPQAMYSLGVIYANGEGVKQDYTKAREWYEKTAGEGHDDAMFNLGALYGEGRGVAMDYVKAREWYEKAAAKNNAGAIAVLDELRITEAASAGRYAEALRLQEIVAGRNEAAETKEKGGPGKATATALRDVAWRALFARDFAKALSASERAHTLLPDDLSIETNWAHALMFTRRNPQARALYLRYKGKPISAGDHKRWERVIADDFAELRKAGVTHPMMAQIEKELRVSR